MKAFGRIIGIDVGTRRIGVARTDLLRTSANTVGTYAPSQVMEVIAGMEKKDPVVAFVVGWPEWTAGEQTDSTRMVEAFIGKLKKRFPGIPVHKFDESYSSKQAVQRMIEAGVSKKERGKKGRIDQAAAALLLQQFLEASSNDC